MRDVDHIAFPRASWSDFEPRFNSYLWYMFGFAPPVSYVDHHLAHAASSYYVSGFESALVVTVDQSGDGTSCGVYRGTGKSLTMLDSIPFPDSLGVFASFMTQYLGFRSNHDEYKVMGLAPQGKRGQDLSCLFGLDAENRPRINRSLLHPEVMHRYPTFHTDQLPMFREDSLPGLPARRVPGDDLHSSHADLAAATQQVIEQTLLGLIDAHSDSEEQRLCIAGGVAENSVALGKLLSVGQFREVYAGPACGDAGTALGAALVVAVACGFNVGRLNNSFLGPAYSDGEILDILRNCGVRFHTTDDAPGAAAELLADQRIVAWFSGRMEFGPRALGGRSLLADPSSAAMRTRVNRIKRREQFRPFGPSVLAEHMPSLFDLPVTAPFMSFTLPATDAKRIVAATHIDGSSRPQTVQDDGSPFRKLIERFYEHTAVPAVLNTSLNSGWEPIITSPEQALAFLFSSEAEALVIGPCVVLKAAQ